MINVRKILGYLGHGLFITGIALGIYVFTDVYILKSKLPEGVCPIIRNRPLVYASIALCGISIILSFFEPKELKD